MKIENVPPDQLIPYARNARTHDPDQIDQIAASILEFGFTNPILVGPDNVIIAGHGRLMAAKQCGLSAVPVIRLGHLTETQRRALVLADNQIATNAGWDQDMLAAEIAALDAEEYGLEILGFGDDEIDRLLEIAEAFPDGGSGAYGGGDGEGEGHAQPAADPDAKKISLSDRFGIPPFSALSARGGWWQDRKRAWLDIGIRSELGRGEDGRAAPGGNVMPGSGSRAGYQPGKSNG